MTGPQAPQEPPTDVEAQVRDYLAAQVAITRQRGAYAPAEYLYAGPADLVLQAGRAWTPAPLPPGIRPGYPRSCFDNAYLLAARSRGRLRYVEGYAAGILPVEHAWCVDLADRVVDPTWTATDPDHRSRAPLGLVYLGLVIDLATVRRCRRRRVRSSASALFDWLAGYPLLRHPDHRPARPAPPRRAPRV